jgi:chitodextrinase
VVIVHGGTYRTQTIPYDRLKRSTKDVIFRPASGAHVVVAGALAVNGRHVEFRNLRTTVWKTLGSAADVTFRSITTARFSIQGSRKVSVLSGSAGPANDASNLIMAASTTARQPPAGITLDRVKIQGYTRTGSTGSVGCLDVRAASGLAIRNSRLFDCEDFGLRFSAGPYAGTPRNVVVENNLFSCCRAGSRALYLDDATTPAWENFSIRNNSLSGSIDVGPGGSAAQVAVHSNIALSFSGCSTAGLLVDYNVWGTAPSCGPNDTVAPSGFADPAAHDFDLLPDAAAIDHGSLGTDPALDIDGQARPLGAAADAGAKESRSSALVAAYPFNESAGTVALDASARDNDGTVSGASRTSTGRFGGALFFDGANDWVTVLDDPSLDLADSLTLEAWVNPRALGSVWRTVIMKEQPGGLSYGLYGETSSGKPSGNVNVGTERDTRALSALRLNTWTHLTATYDGAALRLFVNGKQVSSRPVSGSLTSSLSALRVGGNAVWDEWFDGAIDEVRVYRRALSADEVARDMKSPIKVAADIAPPSAPTLFAATGATTTSISVAWSPATDDSGVAGYGLYASGTLNGTTGSGSYTFTGLTCGTTYTLAVDAYDPAGNRSAQAPLSAATSDCPPPDTEAPTAPAGLVSTAATATSLSVTWTPSADNVAVTGYGVYRNGTSVGSTAADTPTYTFGSLACGTAYGLEVDAYDAVGNRSDKASLTASTSACSPPPGGGSANLWIDTNGGSCIRQAAAGAYADGLACGSFQAAYDAAQTGDTVNIVDGIYGGQGLSAGTKAITFRAAGPGRPSVGQFISAANNITVRGILIEDRSNFNGPCSDPDNAILYPCGDNQTFDDVIIDGRNQSGNHGIRGVGDGFALKNSEVRNIVDEKGFEAGADDMVIENNHWHDIVVRTDGVHNECMFVNGGNRAVYRGNRFIGCPTMALFFTNWNGGPAYTDVLIENNVFAHTLDDTGSWHSSCPLRVGSGYNGQNTTYGWIVRYNTFEVGPCVDRLAGSGQWYGNLGGIDCAASQFVFRYNVGETCGGTGEFAVSPATNYAAKPNQAPFYVNAPGGNFHLVAGAAPINRGDPTRYPLTDGDGKSRPVGAAPDAGSYEYGP